MSKYEIMYIIRSSMEITQVKTIIESINKTFEENNSKVLELKELGLKDLAYEIEHSRKGFYVWARVEATSEAISEFNRRANINENIIRHIVVKEEI